MYISETLFVADANIRYEIFVYIGRVHFRDMQYDFRVSTRRLVLLCTINDDICVLLLDCIVLRERSQILRFRTARRGLSVFATRVVRFFWRKT